MVFMRAGAPLIRGRLAVQSQSFKANRSKLVVPLGARPAIGFLWAPLILPLILPRRFGTDKRAEQGQESLFPRAALQPKSLAGQEKGEERIGHTVEPFDELGGDFRCDPKGPASRPRK
jgi:hypothetical protein